ncbi:MAG: hypothetical protein ACREVZ_03155 [Burkholderiales bacterium]
MRHVVDYLYSLYDALVSINVPSDKARAVVDAMERDMGTTLATKQDLERVTLATKQDLVLLRQEVRQDLQLFRQEMVSMRTELKQEIENRCMLLAHEISTLSLKMTVRLGSMLFVGFGLMIAAQRLWV